MASILLQKYELWSGAAAVLKRICQDKYRFFGFEETAMLVCMYVQRMQFTRSVMVGELLINASARTGASSLQ